MAKYDHRDFRDKTFQPIATALGEVTLAWNDLHLSLSGLFWAILQIPNGLTPGAIWHSIKSDRVQRDMLGALAESHALGHALSPNARKEITWLIKQAKSIEDLRNDLLHSPFMKSGELIFPYHGGLHTRAKKLTGKDILKEARWFYETTIALRDYAEEIEEALRRPQIAWPQRPTLPNRGDSNEKKKGSR